MRTSWTLTLVVLLASTVLRTPLQAQTLYPIDRATILAGAKFDFKVEFPVVVLQTAVKVTVNGVDHATALGLAATFIEKEEGMEASPFSYGTLSSTSLAHIQWWPQTGKIVRR